MARKRGQMLDGVLLLDKPDGLSSHHALQRARRALDAAKAGHTGTLDPFATGLLVCCLGRATKLCGALLDSAKTYHATLRLGSETDSGDLTGEVMSQVGPDFKGVGTEKLSQVLSHFRGVIKQIPPMFSALKRDGKPLYRYAREGIELDRAPRQVTIYHLEVLSCQNKEVNIEVSCSKGTYIRTLAQDIGRGLGCGAHLIALRRTQVGPFSLANAVKLEALQSLPNPHQNLLALDQLPIELLAAI